MTVRKVSVTVIAGGFLGPAGHRWRSEPAATLERVAGGAGGLGSGARGIRSGDWNMSIQWVDSREKLQETIDFPMKYGSFR